MPSSTISGFVKKRTASQRFKRSPRQLTRDITVALEMRDMAVLAHLRIRTEDGAVFEGTELTPDQIKSLRDEGQNPMWFLRTRWLEETFGRRGAGESLPDESDPESDTVPELQESKTDADGDPLTEMMKETIRELKVDKQHLVDQIKIKDDQIKQTTERWKESNVLTKDLHTLIQKMEQGMKISSKSRPVPVQKPDQPLGSKTRP